MRGRNVLPLMSLIFFFTNAAALAQTRKVQRPADGGAVERIISIFIPSLPNAPFTATVNTEWTRQLGDGTTLAWKNHRTVARDSTGRIFEERRFFVPADKQIEPGLMRIEISDPVSHQLYVCRAQEHVCNLRAFNAHSAASPLHAVAAGKGSAGGNIEDLGTQSIEGLEVTGERETTVIESNTMGNNRPLLAKREFWYSPLLGVNLVSKREDPRFGTENFEVTHISIGEPDSKLFDPPAGYKVVNLEKAPQMPAGQTESPN
jgi:hypothetical protein